MYPEALQYGQGAVDTVSSVLCADVLQDELSKTCECRGHIDQQLSDVRGLYADKQQSLTSERKRGDELRAELENISLRLFYLENAKNDVRSDICLLYTSPSPRDS